jgi:phage protein U
VFAELGQIRFQVVGSPEHLESERHFDYAELEVIEARPRLQWLGDNLERLTLDLMFHASFSDPAAQLAALLTAAHSHQGLPLVFGNGVFRGYFVIESVATRSAQLSASGAPIAVAARIELKEFALDSAVDPGAPPIPLFAPLALVTTAFGAAGTPPALALPAATPGAALTPEGVTALINTPQAPGVPAPNLQAGDVPAAVITRSAAD